MGEILGIGITHYPGLIAPDEDRAFPNADAAQRPDTSGGQGPGYLAGGDARRIRDDQGVAAAKVHRDRLVAAFQQQRAELDAFNPDFVLIWGDDQYENFKEDIIRPSAYWRMTTSSASQ